MRLTHQQMVAMYTNMVKIRMFDERVAQLFAQGKIPGTSERFTKFND